MKCPFYGHFYLQLCQSTQTPFLPLDYSGVSLSLVRSFHRVTSPGRWYHNLADHSVFKVYSVFGGVPNC